MYIYIIFYRSTAATGRSSIPRRIIVSLRARSARLAQTSQSSNTLVKRRRLSIHQQSEQILHAVTFVADHLARGELVGDPQRLVVAGHSAGGHLAAVCALHATTRSRLQGAVCISMLCDLEPISLSFLNRALALWCWSFDKC